MNCLDAKNRGKSRWYVTAATGLICIASVHCAGCDSGIAPPDTQRVGTISGAITYSQPWPPADQFREIRFVALRFVPQDTADFLQLNRIEFSEPLAYGVDADSFLIPNVPVGFFPYSGVARQATADIFSWGPIGLYAENQGVFNVVQGETTFVHVVVDFATIPDFPDFPQERPPGASNKSVDLP